MFLEAQAQYNLGSGRVADALGIPRIDDYYGLKLFICIKPLKGKESSERSILQNDLAVVARAWKHCSLGSELVGIYMDTNHMNMAI